MLLSVRPDRPVDVVAVAIIRGVEEATGALQIPYFVAGATARDLLLTHVFGIDTGRATRDVDFAVALSGWDEFDALKGRLAATEGFALTDPRTPHRLNYTHKSGAHYPLDLLPFRGVEEQPNTIAWPPDMKIMMNVTGYEEALATAINVQIDTQTRVRVVSLAGLALLKLFAWLDRGIENPKDALDLATLFRTYPEAGNQDRIYGEEIAVLESLGYEMNLVGPRLLGIDVNRLAAPATLEKALSALRDAKTWETLSLHMSRQLGHEEDPVAAAGALLDQFRTGLEGRQSLR